MISLFQKVRSTPRKTCYDSLFEKLGLRHEKNKMGTDDSERVSWDTFRVLGALGTGDFSRVLSWGAQLARVREREKSLRHPG